MSQQTPQERILDATEQALRRFGIDKTNVVDIARALEMSHANIYRFFPNKKALLLAVSERWLRVVMGPLDLVAADERRPASERLHDWLEKIRAVKRRKLQDDPEVFRIHADIVRDAPELLEAHVGQLEAQLAKIITDGVKAGEFAPGADIELVARAVLQATAVFHHPALLMAGVQTTKDDAEAMLGLLLDGLRKRPRR